MANYTIDVNINGDYVSSQSSGGVAGIDNISSKPQATSMKTFNANGLTTFVATSVAKPFISTAINTFTSNVELTTGSYALQQQVNALMEGVSLGTNVLSYVGAGAALGGGIGAVIGGLVAVTQYGINYLGNVWQTNINKSIEDRQIQYLVNRIGPAYNSSRRGI